MICGSYQVSCFDKGVCPLPNILKNTKHSLEKGLIRSSGEDLIWITEKFRGPEVTIKRQQKRDGIKCFSHAGF